MTELLFILLQAAEHDTLRLTMYARSTWPVVSSFLLEQLAVSRGQPALTFMRLYNASSVPLTVISSYAVEPVKEQAQVTKLECFCFENLVIGGYQTLDLPVVLKVDTTTVGPITLIYILNTADAI